MAPRYRVEQWFIAISVTCKAMAESDYWDGQCTACPSSLYSDKHCSKGGIVLGERGCGFANLYCEAKCSDPKTSSQPLPDQLYWDGQCTPCPVELYTNMHCLNGGVLVGKRSCGTANAYCEGQCAKVQASVKQPEFYWDGQCTACPSIVYKDSHCLNGGELVGERSCGTAGAYCEGQCRLSQSSPPPEPEFYWDGQCTACPASLYTHCPRGGKLIGERGCGPLNLGCEGRCELPPRAPSPADWIIIGGGASGCAAAAALADAGESVIVFERGPSDLDRPQTQQASSWPQVINSDAVQLIRWTDGTWGAVAQVLGGGTAINGGLYIEEEPNFLTDVFGENFSLDEFYASSRWLAENLTTPLQASSFGRIYAEALASTGIGSSNRQVRMSGNSSWIASSTLNTTASGWPRRGAAALLHDRAGLSNLRFFTNFLVQRINFEGKRASSVTVQTPSGNLVDVKANKGIILAAGAILTPQLLQVSGIGDEALLRRLGVEVVVGNAEVGRNFVDRNLLNFAVWASERMPEYIGYTMVANTTLGLTLETEGWGKIASEFASISLGLVPPDQRTNELRVFLTPLLTSTIADIMNNMVQFVALQHNTQSRGFIEAVSVDPKEAPSVTANYFADPRDVQQQFVAMKTLLDLIGSPVLSDVVDVSKFQTPEAMLPAYLSCLSSEGQASRKAMILPCLPPQESSDEVYSEYFRKVVVSSYHYFGTAAAGSVVDTEDFSVKGTENLHVVDASILPRPTRVNPQGTVMALGHYAGRKLAQKSQRRLSDEHVDASVDSILV
jgi:choline dehydrogenase